MFVSGFNIFKQWICEESILTKFREIPLFPTTETGSEKEPKNFELICASWSYNIFLHNNCYYLTGSWGGIVRDPLKLTLPIQESKDIILKGDEKKILLVNKKNNQTWKLENKNTLDWELLPIVFEELKEHKKIRIGNALMQVALLNSKCIYLTKNGSIYEKLEKKNTSECYGCIDDIQCGFEHTIGLTDHCFVYSWGNGRRCQLGHGDLSNVDQPKLIEQLWGVKIVKVQAGGWHSLALSDSGDVYAWGWNDNGQLGIHIEESLESQPLPIFVILKDESGNNEIEAIDIACGSRHSAILLADGSVWTSGLNKYGQLGFDPEKVPMLKTFTNVNFEKEVKSIQCGPWSTILET